MHKQDNLLSPLLSPPSAARDRPKVEDRKMKRSKFSEKHIVGTGHAARRPTTHTTIDQLNVVLEWLRSTLAGRPHDQDFADHFREAYGHR